MDSKLQEIRAAFATFLCEKGFFHTLSVAAQARFCLDPHLESIAAISMHSSGFTIMLRPKLLNLYDRNPQAMFFILMHELRHLHQFSQLQNEDQLLSLRKIETIIDSKLSQAQATSRAFQEILVQFRNNVINIAADAALHEDLLEVFGSGALEAVESFDEDNPDSKVKVRESVTVPRLAEMMGVDLKAGQDWLYYAKKIVDWYAGCLRKSDGELLNFLRTGEMFALPYDGFDSHEIGFGFAVTEILNKAAVEQRFLEEAARLSEFGHGQTEGDLNSQFDSRRQLNESIRKALRLIEEKVRGLSALQRSETKSYMRPHRLVKGLPGRQSLCKRDGAGLDVLVIDVSGSMWVPIFIEQMLSLARYLCNRYRLQAVYSCDVKLQRLSYVGGEMPTLHGGGGTAWTRAHHDQLLADFGVKKGLQILYCTDEEVYSLDDSLRDSRVTLKVLNIPRLIGENQE